MNDNASFLMLEQPCDQAVKWISTLLKQAGFSVMRTFDLQVARHAQSLCPCPHHGTLDCDCQMVVLLIYQADRSPITLIAHGYNGQTRFSIVDTPQQRPDPNLEARIQSILDSKVRTL